MCIHNKITLKFNVGFLVYGVAHDTYHNNVPKKGKDQLPTSFSWTPTNNTKKKEGDKVFQNNKQNKQETWPSHVREHVRVPLE